MSRSAMSEKPQLYKILLDRPAKAGNSYSIDSSGQCTQISTAYVPGAQPQQQHETYKGELDGQIKVLEIDEQSGLPSKVECTIGRLVRDGQSLLNPGTVVIAENATGQTIFSINGAPIDRGIVPVLGMLLNVHQPGTPSDNDVFGTSEEQSVGSVWPINLEAAAVGAARSGIPTSKEDITGESKLVSVMNLDGNETLEIHANFNVQRLNGLGSGGAKILSGTMQAGFKGLFPVDQTVRPVAHQQTMELHMKMEVNGPGGMVIPADLDMTRWVVTNLGRSK